MLAAGLLNMRMSYVDREPVSVQGTSSKNAVVSDLINDDNQPEFETFLMRVLRDEIPKKIEQLYWAYMTGPGDNWQVYPPNLNTNPMVNKQAEGEFNCHTLQLIDRINGDIDLIRTQQ